MVKLYIVWSDSKVQINEKFVRLNDETNFSKERRIEILYKAAEKKIYLDNDIEIDLIAKRTLRRINTAYALMKQEFEDKHRDSWERYFEHLREVTLIVINELENPNVEKVLIAILHDSIEDIELTFNEIKRFFWIRVAIWVQAISKNPFEEYLTESERKKYEKAKEWIWISGQSKNIQYNETIKYLEKKWKELRNEDYFWHLESFEGMYKYITKIALDNWSNLSQEELLELTQNILDVKYADRIHNLRTQWNPNDIKTVERKIEETEKYLLKLAEKTNPLAFKKLEEIINILKKQIEEIIK